MALEVTQHLASIGARSNSASRFYWRSRKLKRLASIGARGN
ncbi:hypothetical protein [Leptospira noguchii]|nr:hypothetical protein [Leptospira noguchii]